MSLQYENNIPSEVVPRVYIGNYKHACDTKLLRRIGITKVLNMTPHDSPHQSLKIPMLDVDITPETRMGYVQKFTLAAKFLRRYKGEKILVHCMAGINRSATAIAFYIRSYGLTAEKTVKLLQMANDKRGVPVLTNPTFMTLASGT